MLGVERKAIVPPVRGRCELGPSPKRLVALEDTGSAGFV